MAATEFVPDQAKTEAVEAHVIWMTTGLSCDGDSVAMTSAVDPSLEDIVTQAIPGMPKVIVHNPVLAYEVGEEFMQAWYDAEEGRLDPFVLVVEGSIPNEELSGEGYWAAMGNHRDTGQPITTNEWVDRLAPKAAAVVARRDLRDLRRHSGDEEQPDRRDGPARLPRLGLEVERRPAGRLHPRAARPSPTTRPRPCSTWRCTSPAAPRCPISTRRTGRPGCSGARCARAATAPASPSRASSRPSTASDHRCLVKLGCKGPVVKCNVPVRGWQSGVGGCPNVGGICMACTMPGFPDKYMPFMDEDTWRRRGGEHHAIHLRADRPHVPPAKHQEQVRPRTRVAQPGKS